MFAADDDGEVGRLGSLVRGAARCGTDVANDVPALEEREDPIAVVAQPDVCRARGIQWPRRELELTSIPRRSTEPQHELLDPEMAHIGGCLVHIAADVQQQPPIDREEGALPDIDREGAATASLHLADR